MIEDQENVVERDRADQVEEEPRAQVVPGNQLRVEDNLFRVILLHYTCAIKETL